MLQCKKKKNTILGIKTGAFSLFVFIFFVLSSIFCKNVFAGEYISNEKRDPFVPLVGIKKNGKTSQEETISTIDNIYFQGVAIDDKGEKNAIINGELVRVGEKMNDMEIEMITEEYVSVRIGDKTYKLRLYE